jgi:siroheme synthase
VEKRKRLSSPTQQINQLIVDNALTYGHVVRSVAGGNPFISLEEE